VKLSKSIAKIFVGPFSEGTLITIDLAQAHVDLLTSIANTLPRASLDPAETAHIVAWREKADSTLREYELCTDGDDETLAELTQEMADLIQEVLPDGFTIGAHEGDGACFGIWPIEDGPRMKRMRKKIKIETETFACDYGHKCHGVHAFDCDGTDSGHLVQIQVCDASGATWSDEEAANRLIFAAERGEPWAVRELVTFLDIVLIRYFGHEMPKDVYGKRHALFDACLNLSTAFLKAEKLEREKQA
jgi:hypothetical protein